MAQNLKDIKALVFDVDGIMTDGGLIATDRGEFLRVFDAKDSFGIRMLVMNGLKVGIITGGDTPGVLARLLVMGIKREDIYLHSRGKIKSINDFCQRNGLSLDEVLYAGDDMPDIPVLEVAGYSTCPCDAVQEVRDIVDYVNPNKGGKGFVRNTCEMVLKAQDKWNFSADIYEKIF